MAITIGAKPESDYTDPLGLLGDCHRRIERFLKLLVTITQSAEGRALSAEQREAMEAACVYFRNAAPKHTLDEEESLFPRLRAASDPRATAALALIEHLHTDHDTADEMHSEVDALVRRWLAEGALASELADRLARLLENLSAIYQQHIAVEESQVFPLAGRVLSPSEIEQMGREMAARRGIDLNAMAPRRSGEPSQ
jgi:hemerythrin-like domain-containing protein